MIACAVDAERCCAGKMMDGWKNIECTIDRAGC
jgi:hypothetical protein